MSSAGGSQKQRKAAVRKESAEAQECESCQQRHPISGDQLGWMARTQVHVRQSVQDRRF